MGITWGKLFEKRQVKFVFQGLSCAGKTTILYHLKDGQLVTTIPTIGFNSETVEFKNFNILAWDLGGRDKMRPLQRHFYSGTEAIIFVIDSSIHDDECIDEARDFIHQLMGEDELKNCVLLVLANKQDLPDAWSEVKLSEALELEKLRTERVWNIFPTVGTTGEGIDEAMVWLTKQFQRRSSTETGTSNSFYTRIVNKLCGIFLDQVY
ncbi:hypothetical protein LSH36_10g03092 [Paralvinella palmiformis]|uniref:ADP-ribosylation factor n=1 Tax=Paralvinella palmiformis TaxID=53620 RepID=A0AAD9KDW5_9ANNE|nr:hypothetical protein LSH36_10g03092 [Paralvinella palmiformis]